MNNQQNDDYDIKKSDKYNFNSPFLYPGLRGESMIVPNATLANISEYQLKVDDMEKSIIYLDENLEHSIALFISYTFLLADFTDILVIYHKEEDFLLWQDCLSMMIKETDYSVFNLSHKLEKREDAFVLNNLETSDIVFVFIKLDHLWQIFPRKNRIDGLVPYVTPPEEVNMALPGDFIYSSESNRLGIAAKPLRNLPGHENGNRFDPYSFEWTCVIFDMHEFEFENRLNVAYVINGVHTTRNVFFMDKFIQKEDPSCLHALVSMARPPMRSAFDYNFTDMYTMHNYIEHDYHVLIVDPNYDSQILTTVVRTVVHKKRTLPDISRSKPVEDRAVVDQVEDVVDLEVEKERQFIDFQSLYFWVNEKGIVEKRTGHDNHAHLIIIPDVEYIKEMKKMDKKFREEWSHDFITAFKTFTTREWYIKRRLEALIRFFNDNYTTQFYLLVEPLSFPSLEKKTKNVTIIFVEERAHLALPEDSNLVIFNPKMILRDKYKLNKHKYNFYIPVMDHWLELQMAYRFLHKLYFPNYPFKGKYIPIPSSTMKENTTLKTLTDFERMSIQVFYYDSDSNRYETFFEFANKMRKQIYAELYCELVASAAFAGACEKVVSIERKKYVTTMATIPILDTQLATYRFKAEKATREKKSNLAAVYRQRYREYYPRSVLPKTSLEIEKVEEEYDQALVEMMEALTLQVNQARPVLLPSESASVYSIVNPEHRNLMISYNNQRPPPIPVTSQNKKVWKRGKKKKGLNASDAFTIVDYHIPCDPCRKIFKKHEEYQKHLVSHDHLINEKIALEEAKFLKPRPIFDNESRGYPTTCPTTLDISNLWKEGTRVYRCVLCSVDFKTGGLLLKHYKRPQHIARIENKTQMIRSCRVCGFKSKKCVEKSVHEMTEAHKKEVRVFTCQFCLNIQYGHRSYSYHVKNCLRLARKAHSPLLNFLQNSKDFHDTTCFICKRQYEGYNTFKKHCDTEAHKQKMIAYLQRAKKYDTVSNPSENQSVIEVQGETTPDYPISLEEDSDTLENNQLEEDSSFSSSPFSEDSPALTVEELEVANALGNLGNLSQTTESEIQEGSSLIASSSNSLGDDACSSSSSTSDPICENEEVFPREDFRYRIYLNKSFIFCTVLFELYEEDPKKYKKGDIITSSFAALESKMTMEDISSYLTLKMIDHCLSKKNSKFYLSNDQTSGLLCCDLRTKFGIIGYFGGNVKSLLHQAIQANGCRDLNGDINGLLFHYFPESLIPLLKELIPEFGMETSITKIDHEDVVNDLFGLYFKIICSRIE